MMVTQEYPDYVLSDDWPKAHAVKSLDLRRAEAYIYDGGGDSDRQHCFYRILWRMYEVTGNIELPIVFLNGDGQKRRMDVGSVNMAVHFGIFRPLRNAPSGYVETVVLDLACLKTVLGKPNGVP